MPADHDGVDPGGGVRKPTLYGPAAKACQNPQVRLLDNGIMLWMY
jgi:hypothetical protein